MVTKVTRGFTIVELLIVVVIIGILAAITLVVYTGIQIRAENTKTVTAVSSYAKALRSYEAINGGYPVTGSGVWACFGSPAGGKCGNVTDATVAACGGSTAPATTSATFDTAIKTVLVNLPEPSTQSITCGTRSFAGAHYTSTVKTMGFVTFYLRGNQSCGTIGGLEVMAKVYTSDVTVCSAQTAP